MNRDSNEYVYFYDVLFKIIKKEFGLVSQGIKIIKKEEKKIEDLVQRKINFTISILENIRTDIKKNLSSFNPLTSHLYYKISFVYMSLIISKYMYTNIIFHYYYYIKENREAFLESK